MIADELTRGGQVFYLRSKGSYLFRRQDESWGGVASILVEDGGFKVCTVILVFLFFGLLAAAHGDGGVEAGPTLFLHRFEGKGMHLTLRNGMILIVLHL